MAATFKHLEHCDKRSRNLLNGYIRESQKLLPSEENSYYIIPDIIIHVCLSFFWNAGIFNQKKHGKNLRFIDARTVEKVNDSMYSVCTIGDIVTDEMCDIFRYEIKLLSEGKNNQFCPYFGYVIGNESINYNYCPGASSNKDVSSGISIFKSNEKSLTLYDKHVSNKKLSLSETSKLKVGDRFMLEFHFKESECYVMYNDDKCHTMKLETKSILPALSLYYIGERISITKYEFDYSK